VALSVKIKLVDKNNKPQANIELAVGFYRSTGSVLHRKLGKTSSAGTATLVLTDKMSTYLPRLALRMKRSGRWVLLSDNPETYTSTTANFGTLEVSTTALKVNSKVSVYGINSGVSSSLNSQIMTLQADKTSLSRQVSVLNSARSNLSRSLSSTRAQLNNEKTANKRLTSENSNLTKSVSDKQTQIEQLNLQLAEKNPDEMAIADVFDNTAKEFESAQEKLKKRQSQFRLGKISMQIKGMPGKTANTLRMIDKDSAADVSSESLSVYNIEFDAKGDKETTTASQVAVPSLEGYTRRIAERKLNTLGLTPLWLEEHLGRGDTAESQHGRVIRQDPPGSTYVERGSDVYITLGKATLSEAISGEAADG